MKYVYPSIFHANEDGSYTITFPDLPGCVSEGKSLPDAMEWAQSALLECLQLMIDENEAIPPASSIKAIRTKDDTEFVTLICADTPLENAA